MLRTVRRRRLVWVIAASLAMLGGVIVWQMRSLADIRPASLRGDAVADPSSEARGRALLQRVAQAHGDGAFLERRSLTVELTDAWTGWMMARMSPWPHNPQRLRFHVTPGTFTSRAELLDGPGAGRAWGIQAWHTYMVAPGDEPRFEHDADVEFVLPTLQYFLEMPFRLEGAQIVVDAGAAELDGTRYERVFATWRSLAPDPKMDQYLVWIDPQQHRIRRVDYTVRDKGRSLAGAVEYDAFEEFEGVLLPTRFRLIASMPFGMTMPAHQVEVHGAHWDAAPPDALRPNPRLPAEGQSKPARLR
jgi:hypothetical protein